MSRAWIEALRQRLAELGWRGGHNLRIDVLVEGDAGRWTEHAGKLVASMPDAIVVVGNPMLTALQKQTQTIPLVFVQVGDPVGSGFVASLSRPGGNITGFMHFEPAMGGKWLEVLKELAPSLSRVLVLLLPEVGANVEFVRAAEAAARNFAVAMSSAGVHDANEIRRAVASFAMQPDGGLIVLPNPITGTHER